MSLVLRYLPESVSKSLAAFHTASLEDLSPVGRRHSLSETVLAASVSLLGLICPEHLFPSFIYRVDRFIIIAQIDKHNYSIKGYLLSRKT